MVSVLCAYTWQEYLILYSAAPTLLPFLVGVPFFKRLPTPAKLMVWLSLIIFVSGAWSAYLWAHSQNNLFIGHIYTVVQFIIIVRIYQLTYQYKYNTRWLSWLMVGFALLAVLNALFLEPLSLHNTLARAVSGGILVFLSLVFFFQTMAQPKTYRAERLPMFWFSSGVFLYFFCTLLILATPNILLQFRSLSIPLWIVHNIFLWLFFVLITIAVWISAKRQK